MKMKRMGIMAGTIHTHPRGATFSPHDRTTSEQRRDAVSQNDVKDYADYVVRVGTRESSLEKYDPNDGENREEYKDDPAKQRALDQKRTKPVL